MDSNMVGATAFEPDMAQVKVTFITTEDDLQLPESKRQLLVPAGTFYCLRAMRRKTNAVVATRHKMAEHCIN